MELITKTYIEVGATLTEVILVVEKYTTRIYKSVNDDIYYIIDGREPVAEFNLSDSKCIIYDEIKCLKND